MGKLSMFAKSKTVWGAILAVIFQVLPVLDTGIVGPKAQAIGTGLGIILGAVGLKDAANKSSLNPQ